MTSLKRFELWLSRTAFGAWMTKAFASRVDPVVFRLSGGRFTSMGPIVIPQLVLTTRGRKSGQERDAQLAYTDIDGVAYVVASNFGGERHPAWSYNLQAEPRAFMQLRDERIPITAQQLSDEEKESVWGRLCENVPNYSAYKEKTDRNIKVYRLSPLDSAAKSA
ncbi:MAG: nitroreductase family deazaflavin-dependent oxidoreductase [Deltaproteobacteria bacterium]|nr:nitroreductase family deazaflavin-dependent oxidoreductase [Deltaproteobacteria bacterium]